MQEIAMQEMTAQEVDSVSGGITAMEGVSAILGLTAMAMGSPVVVGVGLGAAFGLLIAHSFAF